MTRWFNDSPHMPDEPIHFGYMGIHIGNATYYLAKGVPYDVVLAACGYPSPRSPKEVKK